MDNRRILIPYSEIKNQINEGDLFLFRGTGWTSSFIQRAGRGKYSHVGAASWSNGPCNPDPILECVEFREGAGGRAVNFENELKKHNGLIDVYRTTPYYNKYYLNPETRLVEKTLFTFNGKTATRIMRKMTGLPYGWRRIWWMAKYELALLRWFYNMNDMTNDELEDVIYPVCSTTIAYTWNKIGFDLIPNKADSWISPSDVARSALISYIFTPIL
jgi:hypothetical protein